MISEVIAMNRNDWPPENLVVAALAGLDPEMLLQHDGPDVERVQVSVLAIRKLLANPPPMLTRP